MEDSEAEESDLEYFEMLIKKETNVNSMIENKTNWFKSARLDAIKWILERTVLFKFHYTTAYLSVIYFDRFLSRKDTTARAPLGVRLVTIACLSLAAKMEEGKGLPLSKYYAGGYDLQCSNMIRKMELLILRNLEWKMICATPFVYLHYFVTKFFKKNVHGQQIVSKATELILAVMGDAAQQRPSIVAAAAVLAAYDHRLTKTGLEIKMNAVPTWGSLLKEQMFICYKLMRDVVQSRSAPPKSVVSQFR